MDSQGNLNTVSLADVMECGVFLCARFPAKSEQTNVRKRYRRTDRNLYKAYFGFSDEWNVKIYNNYTLQSNVPTNSNFIYMDFTIELWKKDYLFK